MKRFVLLMAVLLSVSAVGYSKSTKLVASVTNPTYAGQHFKKVLIIGMSNHMGIRSDFEDAMAARLKQDGVHAVPGHNILLRPKGTKMDPDYLRAQIKEHKIDAIIVSRLISVKNDVTYIPGQNYVVPYPYYNSFYGYYGQVYTQVYSPGYLREDKTARVETNIYGTSTADGEFVWTGISETLNPNPKKAEKAINAIVDVMVKDMEKQGIF